MLLSSISADSSYHFQRSENIFPEIYLKIWETCALYKTKIVKFTNKIRNVWFPVVIEFTYNAISMQRCSSVNLYNAASSESSAKS